MRRPYSTISIRNPNHNFNYMSNNTNSRINNENSNTICQSPKIYSGKMRYILEDKKLFSLMDLNEKVTNSKGPSLPIQFKRLNSEEIRDLFNGNIAKTYEKLKKLKFDSMKNNLLKNIKIPKAIKKESYIFNEEIKNKNKQNEKKDYDEEKNDTENNIKRYTAHTDSGMEIKSNNKKHEILKRPNTSKVVNINKNHLEKFENNNKNKNDIWMPTNYKTYEQMVKDRKLFIQKMKLNPFYNRLPSCTFKEIQARKYNTDIFFINPPKKNTKYNSYINYKKNVNKKTTNTDCYYSSDIFNIKNDEVSLHKVGEKFLFNNPENIKYTSSRESKSEWEGLVTKDSINNCSSKEYDILTPGRKNNKLTKEKVYNTLDETNNNKNNPIHKHKCVSKFFDLANNSSSNLGKDYINCYNLNPNCFKKVPENCSSYGDLFLNYNSICDRPFYKKGFLV